MELTAIEHMPAIIEQAAKSPLGLFASSSRQQPRMT